ncbi:MAG: hypothetical protein JNK82_04855 [Myxococcaceae bacterium]|nr:hypothetical protein [Myxococcaceae bacterium]
MTTVTETFPVEGCLGGEPAALARLDTELLAATAGLKLGAAARDELLQVARERLVVGGKLKTWSARGPLSAWLRMVVTRLAAELELFTSRDSASLSPELIAGNLELEVMRADGREKLAQTLRAVFASLPSQERAFLRLHDLHGLTLDQLAAMYGESRSSVHRRLMQARARVLSLTRARLGAQMTPADVESLLGMTKSWLDLGLESALG